MKSQLVDIKGLVENKKPVAPSYVNIIALVFYISISAIIAFAVMEFLSHTKRMETVNAIIADMQKKEQYISDNSVAIANYKKEAKMNENYQSHMATNLPVWLFNAKLHEAIQQYNTANPNNIIYQDQWIVRYIQETRTLKVTLDVSGYSNVTDLQSELIKTLQQINRLDDNYYIDYGSATKTTEQGNAAKFDIVYYLNTATKEKS